MGGGGKGCTTLKSPLGLRLRLRYGVGDRGLFLVKGRAWMRQASNRQWVGGEDREGALHILGQNIWGRSPQEPLLTSCWLRVSPVAPESVLGAGGRPCGHWAVIPRRQLRGCPSGTDPRWP